MVEKGVYRSAHPCSLNFSFLSRLGLKTILYLGTDPYRPEYQQFASCESIELIHLGCNGYKEPFVDLPPDVLHRALSVVLDASRYPLLVHCDKGRNRTGCIIGCMRKLQGWATTSVLSEYEQFTKEKARLLDRQMLDLFDEDEFLSTVRESILSGKLQPPSWLPKLHFSNLSSLEPAL